MFIHASAPPRRYLIGSGYVSRTRFAITANEFAPYWLQNIIRHAKPLPQKIVVLAAAGEVPIYQYPVDVIVAPGPDDLGHVSSRLPGVPSHALTGWTAGMLTAAMIAYNCVLDYVYLEQDCLAFGPWVEQLYADMGDDADMVIGRPVPQVHQPCSQSLHLIRHSFIPQFVRDYLLQGNDDNKTNQGEKKMERVMHANAGRIKYMSFGVDRERPLPWDARVWYAQQWNAQELAQAKERGFV